MASLLVGERVIALQKPVVSLGSAAASDVVLDAAGVRASHALLFRDGDEWAFSATKGAVLQLNGRRCERGSIGDGDELRLGNARVVFRTTTAAVPVARAPAVSAPAPAVPPAEGRALGQLASFSSRLLSQRPFGELLAELVSALTELCGAQRGFLVTDDGGGGRRVVLSSGVAEASGAALLSDPIVERVLTAGTPLLVEDAGRSAFARAPSLVSLQLCTAMAVPLRLSGALPGAIFVGRGPGAPPFGRADLEVASAFAALASLLLGQARQLQGLREELARLTARAEAPAEAPPVPDSAAPKKGGSKARARRGR